MEQQLTALLDQTGRDHHQAFLHTNGEDPEWPAWYAAYLAPRFEMLGFHISELELADLLAKLDVDYRMEDPDIPWSLFYARRLLEVLA